LTFSDAQTSPPDARVLLPIKKIAEREGVSKQAVSKNVKRLIPRGLFVERNGRGEVGGVDVVEYYRLLKRPFALSLAEVKPQNHNAMRGAVREIGRLIDRLPLHSHEIALAVARNGEEGASVALKAVAFDLRRDLVEMLRKIATPAPCDPDSIE
jgi:hypothetical protein